MPDNNSFKCPENANNTVLTCTCSAAFDQYNISQGTCEYSKSIPIVIGVTAILLVFILIVAIYSAISGKKMMKNFQNASVLQMSLSLFGLALTAFDLILYAFVDTFSTNFLYYIGFLFWEIMIIVQILNLNYNFFGLNLMIFPLKNKFNPDSVKNYWIKLVVWLTIVVGIFAAIVDLFTNLSTRVVQNETSNYSNEICLTVFVILIDTVQFTIAVYAIRNATVFKKLSQKRISSKLGTKQTLVATLSAVVAIINCASEMIQVACYFQLVALQNNGIAAHQSLFYIVQYTVYAWQASIFVLILTELIMIWSIIFQINKEIVELSKNENSVAMNGRAPDYM